MTENHVKVVQHHDETEYILCTSEDSELTAEFRAVQTMLSLAEEYGLTTEVVVWYGKERAAGSTPDVAAMAALRDWRALRE